MNPRTLLRVRKARLKAATPKQRDKRRHEYRVAQVVALLRRSA